MQRGIFITFEGGEGAGKTTLIEALRSYLQGLGFALLVTREPGGTLLGEKIREIVLNSSKMPITPKAELALFLASRAQHVEEVIFPALKDGKIVLCDRFSDSSVAYQGCARGVGKREARIAANFFASDLIPDLTLYLDLKPETGFKRVARVDLDRIESEKLSFHQKVREAFYQMAQDDPKRFLIIDASQNQDRVYNDAVKLVDRVLPKAAK